LKFSELNLDPLLQSAIDKLGYQDTTPIQTAIMPHVLAGRDVSGLAQTGTGKTAAFLIPLMDRILKKSFTEWRPQNFILILVPTRELAEQVYENVVKFSEFSGLKGVSIYGGTGYEKQKEAFRNHVDFVVATPGRLIDLYKEHVVDLKQVRAIVFDEADRMFDMGFKDDMKYVLQRVPRERQFLVFSATLNFDVLNTAYQFGADPVEIDVSRDQAKAENVKDEIFHVGYEDKPKYLLSLLKKYNPRQVIVFSNFKFNVEKLSNFLNINSVPSMAISSLLTQSQRNRVIELFKADNEKNILVATDVAARGLDIKGVDMVINYELPNDAESYVHRIGRTGRAGEEGRAFSLVSDRDVESLARIEDYLKHKLPVGWIEDAELVTQFKPFSAEMPHEDRPFDRRPRQDRGGGGGGGPRRDNRRDFKGRGPDGGRRFDRNDRNDRNDRRPEAHPRKDRDQRPDNRDRRDNRDNRPQGNGQHHHARRPQGQRSERPQQGQQKPHHHHPRPRHQQAKAPAQPPQQKNVLAKVSGFIKKLFE
jgi:superfamily II DNA/RNA helicase